MAQDPSSHATIPTPNPRERSLVVQVEESVFANNPDILPAVGTLYRECAADLFSKDYYNAKWDKYAYVEQYGELGLLFVKVKTPEEINTPIRPQKKINEPHTWEAVCEWIEFGKATGFPLSQTTINGQGQPALVTADRWLVPRGYRPGQTLITTILIEEYLSDIPWPDWAMECDEPQPTEIMWDLVGSHGSMGKCLHDTTNVPAQSTAGYRVVTASGDPQSANAAGSKAWVFPKTNHKKRRDYTINLVKYVNGQYFRQKLTFLVPTPQAKIIKQS